MLFTKFTKKDEWYTQDKDVEELLTAINLDKIHTGEKQVKPIIWAPFNDQDSAFKRVLTKHGYKVITPEGDFFENFEKLSFQTDYHIIISNPPFSIKTEILKKINSHKCSIPFILLFGTTALNNGSFLREMDLLYSKRFIFIEKRMIFFDDSNKPLKQPPFHSFWLCNFNYYDDYWSYDNNYFIPKKK